jgi:metal-responsive CopG/Arc/MetJ family transcriptional regulator
MQTISLRISDELLAELEQAAKARRVRKSVLVRESLETALRSRASIRPAPVSMSSQISLAALKDYRATLRTTRNTWMASGNDAATRAAG